MYHKNKIYLRKKINVDVILSKIAMLKKYCEFFFKVYLDKLKIWKKMLNF